MFLAVFGMRQLTKGARFIEYTNYTSPDLVTYAAKVRIVTITLTKWFNVVYLDNGIQTIFRDGVDPPQLSYLWPAREHKNKSWQGLEGR